MDKFDRDKAIFSTRAGRRRRPAPVQAPSEVDAERATPGGFGDSVGRAPSGYSGSAFDGDFGGHSSGDFGGFPQDGSPSPVVTPEARTHPLSIAALLFALLCPGPGALVALVCAFFAFRQIRLGDGKWLGDGMTKAAVALSLVQVILIGVMVEHHLAFNRQMEAVRVEGVQFLHDFTRYQEDESFAEKARARMSKEMRRAIEPPKDEHFSFDIADTLGAFHALRTCTKGSVQMTQDGSPATAHIECTATFAPNGPPIAVNMFFVQEGETNDWRVSGFTLKSPLHAQPFAIRGGLMITPHLPAFRR